MKGNKGITLIALVITIIILIILAGVAISTIIGENGLIIRVKDAKERTIKAQLAEEMQLAIIDIQAEYLQKGISLTLEKLQQELPIETSLKDNIGNVELQGNKIIGIYKGYSFEIDSQYKVVIGNKFTGILFKYQLSTEEYTNENVTLTINLEGDATIEGPEDSESITKIDDKTYVIKQNGEYEFKIKDSEGKIETRTISIDIIDRNAPEKPEIEINEDTIQRDKFTIEVVNEVKDNESGIKEYGYFVAEKGKTEYKEYKSSEKKYTVKGLKTGTTYIVYVVAYDNASNESEKSTVLESITEAIPIENILEYPIITKDGIVNCVDNDGKYFLETTVETIATNSILPAAYDGDDSTYFQQNINKNGAIVYINIDESARGKQLSVICGNIFPQYCHGEIYSYNKDGVQKTLVSDFTTYNSTFTIPEDSVSLGFWLQGKEVIYEMQLAN